MSDNSTIDTSSPTRGEKREPCRDDHWDAALYDHKSIEDLTHWASCLRNKINIQKTKIPYPYEFICKLVERFEGIITLIAEKRRKVGTYNIKRLQENQLRLIDQLEKVLDDPDYVPEDPACFLQSSFLGTVSSGVEKPSTTGHKRKEPELPTFDKEVNAAFEAHRETKKRNVNDNLLKVIAESQQQNNKQVSENN